MMAVVACGREKENATVKRPQSRHAEDEQRALAEADGQMGVETATPMMQRGKTETVEPAEELLVAGDDS